METPTEITIKHLQAAVHTLYNDPNPQVRKFKTLENLKIPDIKSIVRNWLLVRNNTFSTKMLLRNG